MAILNYTTTIDPFKSVGEIQRVLAAKGAMGVSIDYESAMPSGLSFFIDINGTPVNFRLPSNHMGVLAAMKRDHKIPKRYKTEQQAMRVSWRILKDWTEAQMAIIEAGLATLQEVFMPYALTNSGQTLFQLFEENSQRLLTA